jgi:hypothetical protein
MSYRIDHYIQMKHRYNKVNKQIHQCNAKKLSMFSSGNLCCKHTRSLKQLEVEKEQATEDLVNYHMKMHTSSKENQLFSGVVFITFETIKDYQAYYDSYPNSWLIKAVKSAYYSVLNIFCTCCKPKWQRNEFRNKIRIDKAPEPLDIIWANLHFTDSERFLRTLWVYLVSCSLILICFGGVIGLAFLKKFINIEKNYYLVKLNTLAVSILVGLINFLIEYILEKLSE